MILVMRFPGGESLSRQEVLELLGEEDTHQGIVTEDVTESNWEKTWYGYELHEPQVVILGDAPDEAKALATV